MGTTSGGTKARMQKQQRQPVPPPHFDSVRDLWFGAVLAFLIGMGFEVSLLISGDLLGLIDEIVAAFEGRLKGKLKAGLAGQVVQNSLPARNPFIEPLERLAKIGFPLGVHVEVVAQFVQERGKALELPVEALAASGAFGSLD